MTDIIQSINDNGYINNNSLKLVQFLTKNIVKCIPLWTEDFISYYSIEEANNFLKIPNESGRLEYKDTIYGSNSVNPYADVVGGSWYLSPYLRLVLTPLANSLPVSDFEDLFSYLMPANVSIYQIISNFYDVNQSSVVTYNSYQAGFTSITQM